MKLRNKILLDIGEIFCITLIILTAAELLLRFFMGAPCGYFGFLQLTDKQLYPPNITIFNSWHKGPYVVRTNSLGLRGPEVPSQKTELKKRIVAIGDSITEGYGVDNNATFPHYLQVFLNSKYPGRFEALNAARGGGSIDKELAILRKVALPLKPAIVLLTFCTNDIYNIRGKDKKELLNGKTEFMASETGFRKRILMWLITSTAIGEVVCKFYLENFLWLIKKTSAGDVISTYYREHLDMAAAYKTRKQGEGRYATEGGNSFTENVKIFNAFFDHSDGLILKEPFSAKTNLLISNYLFALAEFKKICQAGGTEVIFIYFPSYSQVYELTTSMRIREMLSQACQELSIPFLDLTPIFRKEGKDRVLHLAPLDFHLNPDGNEVMAEAIADFLISEKIIE